MATKDHTEDIAYFLSFCIEQYKHAKGIEGEQAERILNEAGALDFLAENFETLHTQGHRWLLAEIDEFINRTQPDFKHTYDIVKGPVANDRVYASFALFEGGFISKAELIEELKAYKLVDQYLFHTELSLKRLQFIEAKEIAL